LDYPQFSYASAEWWNDMLDQVVLANIDFILPVWWGKAWDNFDWSHVGMAKLRQVLIERTGPTPKVGMFYDTSIMIGRDLSNEKEWYLVWREIQEFFNYVPRRCWMLIDGKPLIIFYHPAHMQTANDAFIQHIKTCFQNEFGISPWIIADDNSPFTADMNYRFDTANPGYYINDVCSVSPGYDDRATQRPIRGYVNRQGGEWYRRNWSKISNCNIVLVETWNEWHEGSDIARSYEYGNYYIDLTAQRSARFKFVTDFPTILYRYLLGREPDSGGLEHWSNYLTAGIRPSDVYFGFIRSPEYLARGNRNISIDLNWIDSNAFREVPLTYANPVTALRQ